MLVVFVVQWRVMLGALVAPVDPPGGAIKMELLLGRVATQPVKLHVHRFVLMRKYCVVSDAGGSVVVSFQGRRWLGPTHSDECLA